MASPWRILELTVGEDAKKDKTLVPPGLQSFPRKKNYFNQFNHVYSADMTTRAGLFLPDYVDFTQQNILSHLYRFVLLANISLLSPRKRRICLSRRKKLTTTPPNFFKKRNKPLKASSCFQAFCQWLSDLLLPLNIAFHWHACCPDWRQPPSSPPKQTFPVGTIALFLWGIHSRFLKKFDSISWGGVGWSVRSQNCRELLSQGWSVFLFCLFHPNWAL